MGRVFTALSISLHGFIADHLEHHATTLECIGVVDAPGVTHLTYRVIRSAAAEPITGERITGERITGERITGELITGEPNTGEPNTVGHGRRRVLRVA
jgi:hypothetical protein